MEEQPASNTDEAWKKAKRTRSRPWIFVAVSVAILTIGSAVYLRTFQGNNVPSERDTDATTVSTGTPSAGWRLYHTDRNEYEVLYPADWQFADISVDYHDGRRTIGFNVISPRMQGVPGHEDEDVRFVLQAVLEGERLTTLFPDGSPRGGFILWQGGQEPHYVDLSTEYIELTPEYRIGLAILATFRRLNTLAQ